RRNLNCTAMWYLALVKLKQELWLDSASNFEDAMKCYETNVRGDQASLAAMEALTDIDADFKAKQIAGFQAAIQEDLKQQRAAALTRSSSTTRRRRPSQTLRVWRKARRNGPIPKRASATKSRFTTASSFIG